MSLSMERFDLVVVGAGISGLSTAYHVKVDNPDMRICIVDRNPTYAQGNTARSDAAFRDVFTSKINYEMSSSSISFYRHIQFDLGFNLGMHFNGYLFLLGKEKMNSPVIKELSKTVDSKLIGKEEIKELGFITEPDREAARMMNLDEIEGGFIGKNCGIMEPDLLAAYYYSELEKMGAEFRFNTNITRLNLQPKEKLDYPGEPFIWQDKYIESVIGGGTELKAEQFFLATDVWTGPLVEPLGIDPLIQPKKVQVFQVSGPGIEMMIGKGYDSDHSIFPFTILPSPSIDLRPDPKSKSFWVSYSEKIGRSYGLEENPVADNDFYSGNLYPVLREYVPVFIESKVSSSWAGYYSMNNLDGSYVLFREMNLSILTGSSGSGIMKADSAGRLASALISGKEYAQLYSGHKITVSDLGIKNRNVDRETLII